MTTKTISNASFPRSTKCCWLMCSRLCSSVWNCLPQNSQLFDSTNSENEAWVASKVAANAFTIEILWVMILLSLNQFRLNRMVSARAITNWMNCSRARLKILHFLFRLTFFGPLTALDSQNASYSVLMRFSRLLFSTDEHFTLGTFFLLCRFVFESDLFSNPCEFFQNLLRRAGSR